MTESRSGRTGQSVERTAPVSVEQVCDDFARAWIDGKPLAIEQLCPSGPAANRQELLTELLLMELELRCSNGETPTIEAFLKRFPADEAAVRAAFAGNISAARSQALLTYVCRQRNRVDQHSGDAGSGEAARPQDDALPTLQADAKGGPFAASSDTPPHGPRIVLEVIGGPHTGQRFEIARHDTIVVGRSPQANLRLEKDPHFSRHHFRLEINPPQCRLTDLGSQNGTLVNDQRTAETFLQHGDVISGGVTAIRVSVITARVPVAPRDQAVEPTWLCSPAGANCSSEALLPEATHAEYSLNSAIQIPGYTIESELGRGGMGVVYRAIARSNGRPVALKIMLPGQATDPDRLRLFAREASILGSLRHPHIVRFKEFGIADDLFFVVMEHVDAIPIQEVLKRRPPKSRIRICCSIACRILDALEYAHEKGLVHRDIKPSNILLSRDGRKLRAKLADFGLAKNYVDAGFSDLTGDDDPRGSLAYMSPEQIRNSRYARPPCDVYSLGVTLYQFLTDRLPYKFANRHDVVRAILEDPPIPLAAKAPQIPARLARVVDRALSKDLSERYATAGEMRRDLFEFSLRSGAE